MMKKMLRFALTGYRNAFNGQTECGFFVIARLTSCTCTYQTEIVLLSGEESPEDRRARWEFQW